MMLSLALLSAWSCSDDSNKGTPTQGDSIESDGLSETVAPPLQDSSAGDSTGPEPEDTYVPKEGEFLWPCDDPEDCDSEWCITTAEGQACTQFCVTECPQGWSCEQVSQTGEDLVFVCVPRYARLCDPCQGHSDCLEFDSEAGNQCIDYGPLGSFCGVRCNGDVDCPSGYSCQELPTTEFAQCIPVDSTGAPDECSCSKLATALGKSTTCFGKNEHGTCYGFRECAPGGLTECSADTPSVEICNGQDDNCDNQVDNITVPEACHVTNEYGICTGNLECKGFGQGDCLGLDSQPLGAALPEVCDGLDQNCDGIPDDGFADTDLDGTADCIDEDDDNDGILDNVDNCPVNPNPGQEDNDGDGAGGSDVPSPGGDVCDNDDDNDGSPDDQDCEPLKSTVHPDAQEICDGLDNDCDDAIDEDLCDDGNLCTDDSCNTDGTCTNTPNSILCDDQSVCTQVDLCKEGVCTGMNPVLCDDGNFCTTDTCDSVIGCNYNPNTEPCDDGNACTENDTCGGGQCIPGAPKNCDDANPCTDELGCSPLTGCKHTAGPTGVPCTFGGGPCTQGQCNAGFCQPVDGGFCNTGNGACPQGTCSGGNCFIKSGQICEAEIDVDLCNDVKVAGQCSAAGECVVNQVPPSLSCPGCNGICIQCFITICLPFGGF